MSTLHALAKAARDAAPNDDVWSDDRSRRVLASLVTRQEKRAQRARFVRRGAGVASAAAVIVFALLRGATAAPSASSSAINAAPVPTQETVGANAANAELLAASDRAGDGGFGRD